MAAFTESFTNKKKQHTSLKLLFKVGKKVLAKKFQKRYRRFIANFEQDLLLTECLNNSVYVTLPWIQNNCSSLAAFNPEFKIELWIESL